MRFLDGTLGFVASDAAASVFFRLFDTTSVVTAVGFDAKVCPGIAARASEPSIGGPFVLGVLPAIAFPDLPLLVGKSSNASNSVPSPYDLSRRGLTSLVVLVGNTAVAVLEWVTEVVGSEEERP